MNFTKTQEAAINTKGQNILVSASAGSGKTRVLVQRVLQRLIDDKENVDEFLIVTFTKAAAAEMKERLEKAIRAELQDAQGEDRQHLLKQLRLLNVANISTLHAFAQRLIEQYHYTIDLDPQFRLLDDAERTLLMHSVYQELLENAYESDEDGSFKALVEQFKTASQDDAPLRDAVFTLFNFAMARPDSSEWLANLAKSYEVGDSFTDSTFFKQDVMRLLRKELETFILEAQNALKNAPDAGDNEQALNRKANLEREVTYLESLDQMLSNPELNWDTFRSVVRDAEYSVTWGKKRDPKAKGGNFKDDDEYPEEAIAQWEVVKKQREARKKNFSAFQQNYFALDEAAQLVAISGAQATVAALVVFTEQFRDAFLKAKLAEKSLDFNDLEHFSLQIVQQDAVAADLQKHYREVMVDEYQDTNQLQEAILGRIAGDDNTFQVGDIKQSIYKFRQADPSLFASKLANYPKDEQSEVITLQENFRSHPNVTKFINYIFAQIMSEELGDVEYTNEAELVAGAEYYPENVTKNAELLVYLSDEDNEGENYSKDIGQIRLMAAKIKGLVDDPETLILDRGSDNGESRRPTYSDIAILVPTKARNLDVVDVFNELDIPVSLDGAENFFQTTEISVMLSLLRVIDNPHQDIPLAAVLRSPMYGLDENELGLIRLQDMQGDFYQAVQAFYEKDVSELVNGGLSEGVITNAKTIVSRFMMHLEDFKVLATQNQLVDLVWRIFDKTGWLDYMGGLPSGPQRQANLHALYERAASFQQSNFVGLYQFVSYITELQEKERDLGVADANVTENSVRLMTIHRSKGLEFPIVFLLNSTRKMVTNNDTTGAVLVDAYAGAGLDYIDPEHQIKLPTVQREVVKDASKRGAFAEQLRVLYVALTRAEQEIFLVGSYDTKGDMLSKWDRAQFGTDWMLPEWVRLQGKSYMDLAGMALFRHPDAEERLSLVDADIQWMDIKPLVPKDEFVKPKNEEESAEFEKNKMQFKIDVQTFAELTALEATQKEMKTEQSLESDVVAESSQVNTVDVSDWQSVLQYDYQFESATHATAYQSVSEIKRLFEDPDLSEGRQIADKRLDPEKQTGLRFVDAELSKPKFMQEKVSEPSAAAIGTATHLVLQRVDLSEGAPSEQDVVVLLDNLVETGLLEADVAKLVKVENIVKFFTDSELGQMMIANQATLEREVPFSLLLDGEMLYKNFKGDDRVLVHGIIDGYFKVGDAVWMFDYKTDRLKNDDTAELKERYAGQLNIYAQALIAMGMPQPKMFIYSLSSGQTVTFD